MRKWLILALFVGGCAVYEPEPGPPDPAPIVTPDPPNPLTAEQKEWVKELIPVEDEELSDFYAAFADIVRRDTEIIATTGDIREAHVRAGRLMFQNRRERNPELASAVDAAFKKAIGLQNVALTDDKREEVILLLEALSWATK